MMKFLKVRDNFEVELDLNQFTEVGSTNSESGNIGVQALKFNDNNHIILLQINTAYGTEALILDTDMKGVIYLGYVQSCSEGKSTISPEYAIARFADYIYSPTGITSFQLEMSFFKEKLVTIGQDGLLHFVKTNKTNNRKANKPYITTFTTVDGQLTVLSLNICSNSNGSLVYKEVMEQTGIPIENRIDFMTPNGTRHKIVFQKSVVSGF